MGFSSGNGGKRQPMSEINVTPFVDVMLVLLIIFMVATPMMTPMANVEIDLPNAEAPPLEVDEEMLLLSVDAEQKIFLGETEVPYERLEEVLATNDRLRTDNEIYVRADETVPYGFVARIFAMIRKAGVEKLGLVMEPETPTAPVP